LVRDDPLGNDSAGRGRSAPDYTGSFPVCITQVRVRRRGGYHTLRTEYDGAETEVIGRSGGGKSIHPQADYGHQDSLAPPTERVPSHAK
jgi:hypothetical protein